MLTSIVTVPSTTGWPGPAQHPVNGQHPACVADLGRVVVAAALEPATRITRSPQRRPRGRAVRSFRVVADDLRDGCSQPISCACAASINEFVSRISPGWARRRSVDLVACRDVTTPGGRRTSRSWPRRAAGGDVDRAAVSLGKQELGGADVLADRADMLVGRRRRLAKLGSAVGCQWTCSRITTASYPTGSGSPVSTTVELPGGQEHRCGLGRLRPWRPPRGRSRP